MIEAWKQTANFLYIKYPLLPEIRTVNRVIGRERIRTSYLLSFPHFYFWSNKHWSGNQWYNWWMKRKLNVPNDFTDICRLILRHNRIPGSKILNGIEFQGFQFRGSKYITLHYITFVRFRCTISFSNSFQCGEGRNNGNSFER